jgi:transcriptional regulator with XRE-family HTH domain
MRFIDKILAKNIADLRKERGWTQDAMAEHTGLSVTAIARFETCRVWPSLKAVRKIAESFQVSESRLFLDTENDLVVHHTPTEEEIINALIAKLGYKPIRLKREGKWPKKNSLE